VLGVSIDSPFANAKFAAEIGVGFPLLSDMKREASRSYGVLDEERQVARRTTFVIDREGVIRHVDEGAAALSPAGAVRACSVLRKQ
jgi:peroxiredoxin